MSAGETPALDAEHLVVGGEGLREFGAGEEALSDAGGELEERGAARGVEFADDVVDEHCDVGVAFCAADEA